MLSKFIAYLKEKAETSVTDLCRGVTDIDDEGEMLIF